MDIQNITDILGDGNFNLQNITGSNINIITGSETDPAITAKKREIANHIAELIKQLDTKRKNPDAMPWTADATDFDELDFENLVSAIE